MATVLKTPSVRSSGLATPSDAPGSMVQRVSTGSAGPASAEDQSAPVPSRRPLLGATPPKRRYWSPSKRLLEAVHDYAAARDRPGALAVLEAKVAVLKHRFWSAITSADIPLNTWGIGENLHLPHPTGIVLHPEVEIGADCQLFQQVTLGTGPKPGVPRLGNRVVVFAGAKILGGVRIGDDAVIGANAVVLEDVPPGATAVGIPAVIKPTSRRWPGL